MHLYLWLLICSSGLLLLLFYTRSGVRKKYVLQSWLERVETIARDNHTLWCTHLPYSQKSKLVGELEQIEKDQKGEFFSLKVDDKEDWVSVIDLKKYPSIKRLFKKLLPSLISYSRMLGLDPKFLTIQASIKRDRCNLNEKPKSNQNALFSGLYVLKGSEADPSSCSSELFFYSKHQEDSLMARFHPQSGDLLLFPSDMNQKVGESELSKDLMSIAFDVYFGTKKRSWLISELENIQEKNEEKNLEVPIAKPLEEDLNHETNDSLNQSTHFSKIKK